MSRSLSPSSSRSLSRCWALNLLPLLASIGCGPGGPAAPGDASTGSGGQDGGASGRGVVVALRGIDGESAAALPVLSAGARVETAAVWFKRIEIVSDQGGSGSTQVLSQGFDVGAVTSLSFPDAVPGLYSLARVDIAAADHGSTALPSGFGGNILSARATGHLPSGRAFDISTDQGLSADLRPGSPVELLPGTRLVVTVDMDVSRWLQGLSLDEGGDAAPLVIGPESHGDLVDAFSTNVLASLRVGFR